MTALVSPVIVGRDSQLAALGEALRDVARGVGRTVFVLGEAGIGKTRLVQAARSEAEEAGMRVLFGRAVESGAQVPFRPFAESFQAAFRKQGGPPAALAAFHPVLGKLVPAWASDKSLPESNPVLLFEAVVRLLELISQPSGAVFILEDLHWADAETLSAVDYLTDQISDLGVAVLITARIDEPLESARSIDRIAARIPSSRLVLERLTEPAIEQMTKQLIGDTRTTSGLLEAVKDRSEGVPLLIEELLSSFADKEEVVGDITPSELQELPSSYASIVERRLSLLDDEAREVLVSAAALGAEFETELLAAVTHLPSDRVRHALRSCRDASLLVHRHEDGAPGLAFRHALVADAVLAQLLPDERRDLYRRVADSLSAALPGLPGEWCSRVAELRTKAGDDETAADLFMEVGRRALKRGALLTAEQALERARILVQGDRWKTHGGGRVLIKVLSLLGNTARLRELGDSTVAFMEEMPDLLGTPERQADVLLQIARGIASSRDWETVRDSIRPVLRVVEHAPVSDLRARVLSFQGRVALELGDLETAGRASAAALADGVQLGSDEATLEAQQVRAGLALASNDIETAMEILQKARLHAERRDLTLWRVELLLDLAAVEELTTGSLGTVFLAQELVGTTEAPLAEARVALQVARTRLARFELDLAEEALRRGVEMCRRYRLPLLREALSLQAQMGALKADAQLIRASVKEAQALPTTSVDAIGFSEAQIVIKLVRGDVAGAARELSDALDLIAGSRLQRHRWLGALVFLMHAMGHVEPRPSWSSMHPFVRHAEVVQLGRQGNDGSAEATFDDADRALAAFPWIRNLGRRMVAEAALQDGWGRPAEWLAEASAFFTSAGHAGLAAACNGLLRRAGVAVPRRGRGRSTVPKALSSAGITSREMDVLDLVREGLSNTDIADRLYISVRTVESHVASAMRKMGAGRRAQLIAQLVDQRAESN